MFFDAIFKSAPEGKLVEIAIGLPPVKKRWVKPTDISRIKWPEDNHCFYAPALRSCEGGKKEDVWGTHVLWVDIDTPEFRRATLPPTFVIASGHGWHFYWLLDTWTTDKDAVERANKILIEDVKADEACSNVNRFMRVPGTWNEGTWSKLHSSDDDNTYSMADFLVLEQLDRKVKHKIRTGDSRGFPSRSERDWHIASHLLSAEASDDLIRHLFKKQACGDKVRDPKTHPSYLDRTLDKARESPRAVVTPPGKTLIKEKSDGYYRLRGKAETRISTFLFEPDLLLDGSMFGTTDAFVGKMITEHHVWSGVTLTKNAFTRVSSMDKETPTMGWQWLGKDEDVRNLLPYLLENLRAKGFPHTTATSILGFHELKNQYYFVGTRYTLSEEQEWDGTDSPLVYLDPRREHPVLPLAEEEDPEVKATVRDLLPQINEPTTIWPIIGWYFATPFKILLEREGYRFPILNAFGTKGSGKTTTLQRVMMPLLGQTEAKSYDANTTRFVVLSLLGSTNSVPISFSEFRFGSADKFLRYVLLAYDTGHDPRGRADQTTVDYPLSAPFTVDGEDLIADPACKERILAAALHPAAIEEGGNYYNAFQELRRTRLDGLAKSYLKYSLRSMRTRFKSDLKDCSQVIFDAYPQRLPDRVRNNLIVAWYGIRSYCRWMDYSEPEPSVLGEALQTVFNTAAGRAPIAIDEMVESLINAANRSVEAFAWDYDAGRRVFWFQFSSGYQYWERLHKVTSVLGKDALRTQLNEAGFAEPSQTRRRTRMVGVSLEKAIAMGLDVPEALKAGTLEVNF